MIITKICFSCDPPTEWPLNEKFWYKMKNGKDGWSNVCKRCYKKRVTENRRHRRKLEEKNKPREGSKVPYIKPYKPKKIILKRWSNDLSFRAALQCRFCQEVYEIKSKYFIFNCPKCSRNLLLWGSINFLWAKPIKIDKRVRGYSILKFDMWR